MEHLIQQAVDGLSDQEKFLLGNSSAQQFNGALDALETGAAKTLQKMRREEAKPGLQLLQLQ